MNLQENIHRIQEMMGINESMFFRRRSDIDKIKELLPVFVDIVFYDYTNFDEFKYQLTIRALEYYLKETHDLYWDELPEQEEIEFVNYLSEIFNDTIKEMYMSKIKENTMNLQETIRKILREESRFEKMGEDNYKSCSMSDITRMEIIDDFFNKVSNDPNYNIDKPDYDMLLDDWDGYDDQVYIQNKLDNNTIIFYEGWVDSCWSAVYNKPQYKGMSKKQVIKDIITNRFPRIGEEFNMTIKDYGYINDDGYIMYVVLEKY